MKPCSLLIFVLWLVTRISTAANAADQSTPLGRPQVYSYSAENLVVARQRLEKGDAALQPALQQLRADAERALTVKPVSVMDKTRTPPSGDKHDYLSQAPYWWPDPAKPDGLPYIRRDGDRNPEVDRGTDKPTLVRMQSTVGTLALAYFFTHSEAYAAHAAKLLRIWFLDPATRMNPQLEFAQYIPGINSGRGIGIIETAHFGELCDAVALLAGSPAWSEADARGFRSWLNAYFQWLTTSKYGRDEAAAENNHGTWYDAQAAHLALALGKPETAKAILTAGLKKRLEFEIEPDGSQPREMARTKSLGYSTMNLEAMFTNARLAAHVGVDWWRHQSADGRSLRAALAYLTPYLDPTVKWRKQYLLEGDRGQILALAAEAAKRWDDAALRTLVEKHGTTPALQAARWHLLLNMP